MSTLVTRAGKGSPLTHNEVDTNFTNLNTDKVEKTAADITGGTINNTTIGATTPSTGVFTTLTATGQTSLGGVAGSESLRVVTPAATGSFVQVQSESVSFVGLRANGSNPNNGLGFISRGTGAIGFYTNNSTSNLQLNVFPTASAVNYVQVTGAATGGSPTISAQGSDTNLGLNLSSRGTRAILFYGRNFGGIQFATGSVNSAVNYFLASGATAGNSPVLLAEGTDTNISQVFQSKGTGAIDLAAGSSGVNISNGGTVTALTLTNSGSGYTSFPTLAISTPTTAGGVQTTASFTMRASPAATIASGGTGYTVGDVLTFTGGTFTSAIQVTVATVSSGVITGITSTAVGSYSVLPSNPISVTGGTGSGATFNQTWGIAATLTITNAGSGYVEQPTVTFSGGGGSSAAAYATVGSGTTVKSIGSTMLINTPGGTAFGVTDIANSVNYIRNQGSSTGFQVFSTVQGTDTNTSYAITSKGNGAVNLYSNLGSQLQFTAAHTASAVNYVQVTGAVTGADPVISAQGSDANRNLRLSAKGTGQVATTSSFLAHIAATNYIQLSGGATGFGPVLSAQGSDTNIPAVVQPKGTGALQAQQTTSTATGGNARGANAVDWQTTRSNAVMVASGSYSVVAGGASNRATGNFAVSSGGNNNTSSGFGSIVVGGNSNTASSSYAFLGAGQLNTVSGYPAAVVTGVSNTAAGFHNFIGGGFTNSGTSGSAVTTQSATMNGTTAVTLSGSNANIKVGQWISGTSIADETYVAAISGTSLTLSKVASGSSTSTLSFYTPHGVVVGGGNNQATGSYSFIGGGGDAGTAANRNVASGDWSVVAGGFKNTASGIGSSIAGGFLNTASGTYSFVSGIGSTASGSVSAVIASNGSSATTFDAVVIGGEVNTASGINSGVFAGAYGTTRGINGATVFPASTRPITTTVGVSQSALLVLGRQTTDATPTVLTSDPNAASTTNQVILPNNSAYYFKVEIIANVTGGSNTSGWELKGVIKRGANAASTTIVGSVTSTLIAQDAGASTWVVSATADTTNGGLKITCTGQASTTIRWVAKASTTEVTF